MATKQRTAVALLAAICLVLLVALLKFNDHKLDPLGIRGIFDDTSTLPIYEVGYSKEISPFRVRRALQNGVVHFDPLVMEISSPSYQFTVHLHPKSASMLSQGYKTVTRNANGHVVIDDAKLKMDCVYQGHIDGHANSSATLTNCSSKGFAGLINTGEKVLVIQPAGNYQRMKRDASLDSMQNTQILYAQPDIDFCAEPIAAQPEMERNVIDNRAPDNATKTLEIAVFVEDALYNMKSSHADTNAKLDMNNLVNGPDKHNGEIKSYLQDFCKWQYTLLQTSKEHWDHALLLTGTNLYAVTNETKNFDIMGMSWAKGMCEETLSCSIVEGVTFDAVFVIAHEIGHNLGINHDGVGNKCASNNSVMSTRMGTGRIGWSSCSSKYLQEFLKLTHMSCLDNPSYAGLITYEKDAESDFPGHRFPADLQCKSFFGETFEPFVTKNSPYNNICKELWCTNGTHGLMKSAALDGTTCDTHMVCNHGLCKLQDQIINKETNANSTTTVSMKSPNQSIVSTVIHDERLNQTTTSMSDKGTTQIITISSLNKTQSQATSMANQGNITQNEGSKNYTITAANTISNQSNSATSIYTTTTKLTLQVGKESSDKFTTSSGFNQANSSAQTTTNGASTSQITTTHINTQTKTAISSNSSTHSGPTQFLKEDATTSLNSSTSPSAARSAPSTNNMTTPNSAATLKNATTTTLYTPGSRNMTTGQITNLTTRDSTGSTQNVASNPKNATTVLVSRTTTETPSTGQTGTLQSVHTSTTSTMHDSKDNHTATSSNTRTAPPNVGNSSNSTEQARNRTVTPNNSSRTALNGTSEGQTQFLATNATIPMKSATSPSPVSITSPTNLKGNATSYNNTAAVTAEVTPKYSTTTTLYTTVSQTTTTVVTGIPKNASSVTHDYQGNYTTTHSTIHTSTIIAPKIVGNNSNRTELTSNTTVVPDNSSTTPFTTSSGGQTPIAGEDVTTSLRSATSPPPASITYQVNQTRNATMTTENASVTPQNSTTTLYTTPKQMTGAASDANGSTQNAAGIQTNATTVLVTGTTGTQKPLAGQSETRTSMQMSTTSVTSVYKGNNSSNRTELTRNTTLPNNASTTAINEANSGQTLFLKENATTSLRSATSPTPASSTYPITLTRNATSANNITTTTAWVTPTNSTTTAYTTIGQVMTTGQMTGVTKLATGSTQNAAGILKNATTVLGTNTTGQTSPIQNSHILTTLVLSDYEGNHTTTHPNAIIAPPKVGNSSNSTELAMNSTVVPNNSSSTAFNASSAGQTPVAGENVTTSLRSATSPPPASITYPINLTSNVTSTTNMTTQNASVTSTNSAKTTLYTTVDQTMTTKQITSPTSLATGNTQNVARITRNTTTGMVTTTTETPLAGQRENLSTMQMSTTPVTRDYMGNHTTTNTSTTITPPNVGNSSNRTELTTKNTVVPNNSSNSALNRTTTGQTPFLKGNATSLKTVTSSSPESITYPMNQTINSTITNKITPQNASVTPNNSATTLYTTPGHSMTTGQVTGVTPNANGGTQNVSGVPNNATTILVSRTTQTPSTRERDTIQSLHTSTTLIMRDQGNHTTTSMSTTIAPPNVGNSSNSTRTTTLHAASAGQTTFLKENATTLLKSATSPSPASATYLTNHTSNSTSTNNMTTPKAAVTPSNSAKTTLYTVGQTMTTGKMTGVTSFVTGSTQNVTSIPKNTTTVLVTRTTTQPLLAGPMATLTSVQMSTTSVTPDSRGNSSNSRTELAKNNTVVPINSSSTPFTASSAGETAVLGKDATTSLKSATSPSPAGITYPMNLTGNATSNNKATTATAVVTPKTPATTLYTTVGQTMTTGQMTRLTTRDATSSTKTVAGIPKNTSAVLVTSTTAQTTLMGQMSTPQNLQTSTTSVTRDYKGNHTTTNTSTSLAPTTFGNSSSRTKLAINNPVPNNTSTTALNRASSGQSPSLKENATSLRSATSTSPASITSPINLTRNSTSTNNITTPNVVITSKSSSTTTLYSTVGQTMTSKLTGVTRVATDSTQNAASITKSATTVLVTKTTTQIPLAGPRETHPSGLTSTTSVTRDSSGNNSSYRTELTRNTTAVVPNNSSTTALNRTNAGQSPFINNNATISLRSVTWPPTSATYPTNLIRNATSTKYITTPNAAVTPKTPTATLNTAARQTTTAGQTIYLSRDSTSSTQNISGNPKNASTVSATSATVLKSLTGQPQTYPSVQALTSTMRHDLTTRAASTSVTTFATSAKQATSSPYTTADTKTPQIPNTTTKATAQTLGEAVKSILRSIAKSDSEILEEYAGDDIYSLNAVIQSHDAKIIKVDPGKVNAFWMLNHGPCSASCGGGIRQVLFECKYLNGSTGTDCLEKLRPDSYTEVCSTQICQEPQWTITDWIGCNATCKSSGTEEAVIVCDTFLSRQMSDILPDEGCKGAKPVYYRPCILRCS